MSPGSVDARQSFRRTWCRLIGNVLVASGLRGIMYRDRAWRDHTHPLASQPARPRSGHHPHARCSRASRALPDPIALIEVLSPGNAADTWDNVWAYTTIPSVREIDGRALHPRLLAEHLRRGADGHWPAEPEEVGADGVLRLEGVGVAFLLREAYAQTHLA